MNPLFDMAQQALGSGVAPSTVVGGAGGAAAVVGSLWFARLMFTRMIRQYDEAQKEHRTQLSTLATQVAVLEARREDRRELDLAVAGRLGVVDDRLKKLDEDVGTAHRRIEAIVEGRGSVALSIKKPDREAAA